MIVLPHVQWSVNVEKAQIAPENRALPVAWIPAPRRPMVTGIAGAEVAMTQFGIGQPVRRVEDRRFLTGRGHYLDDIIRPRQAHAVMLRSPHAHARIRAIDTQAAAGPGVLAILTGADLAADGSGTIPCMSGVANMAAPPRPAISGVVGGRVRHVGD